MRMSLTTGEKGSKLTWNYDIAFQRKVSKQSASNKEHLHPFSKGQKIHS
jgi:hypothetical protein